MSSCLFYQTCMCVNTRQAGLSLLWRWWDSMVKRRFKFEFWYSWTCASAPMISGASLVDVTHCDSVGLAPENMTIDSRIVESSWLLTWRSLGWEAYMSESCLHPLFGWMVGSLLISLAWLMTSIWCVLVCTAKGLTKLAQVRSSLLLSLMGCWTQ